MKRTNLLNSLIALVILLGLPHCQMADRLPGDPEDEGNPFYHEDNFDADPALDDATPALPLPVDEEVDQSAGGRLTVPITPRNFVVDESGSDCKATRFTYTKTPPYQGRQPLEYVLERKRDATGRWMKVAGQGGGDGAVIYDGRFIPMPHERYQYRLKARYPQGYSRSSAVITRRPVGCEVEHDLDVTVFLFSPNDISLPYGNPYADDVVFDETPGSLSVHNYLVEVSAGLYATPQAIEQHAVQIEGTTRGWYWLPHGRDYFCKPGSNPCAGVMNGVASWLWSWDTYHSLRAMYPADYYVVIINDDTTTNGGGVFMGGDTAFVGSSALNGKDPHTIIHELGHAMGLNHNPGIYCPDGVFPSNIYYQGNCRMGVYANMADPMSGVDSLAHFPAYSKWILGFLPGSRTIETSLTSGQSRQYRLHEASMAYYGNYTQLVMIKLDDYDTHLTVEFRRPVGFNEHAGYGDTPLPEGVYVSLRPGRTRNSNMGGNDLYTPYHYFSWNQPDVATKSQDFYDPNLGIRVEVRNMYSYRADITISRD